MAKVDDKDKELKKFLRGQKAKREIRERARAEAALQADLRRRAGIIAALEHAMTLIPDEVKEYASVNVQADPPRIELVIPDCQPIRIKADGGGIFRVAVQGVDAFPLRDADDLSDAIAVAATGE